MWAALMLPVILMVTMLIMQWLESRMVGTSPQTRLHER
ncbi:hypothetical protein SAMN05216266_114196 [Amycolatopsis marina]|uniref:Uncharacterized protein n=1 Tax=Amycolatopsis marina TaxID=490629 RepID=A0A1I1BLM6_9PSEU|nr:hypothetical protein SAMN05216266_114196 [Amycolatopsis marina]